jgi:hypothetical protein
MALRQGGSRLLDGTWLAGGWASDSTHLFTALKTRLLRPLASKHEQSATTQWFAGGVPVEKTSVSAARERSRSKSQCRPLNDVLRKLLYRTQCIFLLCELPIRVLHQCTVVYRAFVNHW